MATRLFLVLIAALVLTSCGNGGLRLNNPFRKGDETVALVPPGGFPKDNDSRLLIDQVTELRLERTPGGIVVRATGLPPRLGYWEAELVPDNDGLPVKGVLSFAFRVYPPLDNQGSGSEYSRRVIAGQFVSNAGLEGVTRIQVRGARNSRTARRR